MICRSRKEDLLRTMMVPTVITMFIAMWSLSTATHSKNSTVHDFPLCKPGLFDCQESVAKCVSASWICDGEVDCLESGLDERQSCCAEGKQFECLEDGLCVDMKYRCDSFADCSDSSDERECSDCEARGLFQCKSDRCIDPVFVCDEDNDCGDFSDEINCNSRHPNAFTCQSGELMVTSDKLCDGFSDCGDLSDEVGCEPCEPFHFPCQDNLGCVLVFDLCDGEPQCLDGSDEMWCEECANSGDFKCKNGECISRAKVCDYVDNCGDKSDENICSCKPGNDFRCTSGIRNHLNASNLRCIPDEWICDGTYDCKDGEDEKPAMCFQEGSGSEKIHECESDEFECSDKHCIKTSEVCDGIEQCFRGEDEVACPNNCPRGKYELCLTTDECISYDQFCDGKQDCADNHDESYTNGYCFCSGILCGNKCVPVEKICDSTWDCKHGEDEIECTKCRTNLQSTSHLMDQTVFVTSLIKETYTQMDSFQIYFAALVDKLTSAFGVQDSPFHIDVEAHDPDAQKLVEEAQKFLISIVSQRQVLSQFMSVMMELRLTDETLPVYIRSETPAKQNVPRQKRYIIERTEASEAYDDLVNRVKYLREKATDSVQTLSAITKMLHYDFSTCKDHGYFAGMQNKKRSMREVFTALSMVQNDVPREKVHEFIEMLYSLDDQLKQLIVSVQKFDYVIASLTFLIDDAGSKLQSMVTEELSVPTDTKKEEKQGKLQYRSSWNNEKLDRYHKKYNKETPYKG